MTGTNEPDPGAPWGPACGVRPTGVRLTPAGLLPVEVWLGDSVACPAHLCQDGPTKTSEPVSCPKLTGSETVRAAS